MKKEPSPKNFILLMVALMAMATSYTLITDNSSFTGFVTEDDYGVTSPYAEDITPNEQELQQGAPVFTSLSVSPGATTRCGTGLTGEHAAENCGTHNPKSPVQTTFSAEGYSPDGLSVKLECKYKALAGARIDICESDFVEENPSCSTSRIGGYAPYLYSLGTADGWKRFNVHCFLTDSEGKVSDWTSAEYRSVDFKLADTDYYKKAGYAMCTEISDDANDPAVKGVATTLNPARTYTDSCSGTKLAGGTTRVTQYYCPGPMTPSPYVKSQECPIGQACIDGACQTVTLSSSDIPKCTDTDPANDLAVKGELKVVRNGRTSVLKDSCYPKTVANPRVLQYSCASTYQGYSSAIKPCPSGKMCSDGACVAR
ncbi:MAG: hypothetical protein HYW25_06030 [Candidatus Aenigmarchaeota archaeon]|nr:hypothetical protein [Candidatus Aenigmarchaeota archaeon]